MMCLIDACHILEFVNYQLKFDDLYFGSFETKSLVDNLTSLALSFSHPKDVFQKFGNIILKNT